MARPIPGTSTHTCTDCGAQFTGGGHYRAHVNSNCWSLDGCIGYAIWAPPITVQPKPDWSNRINRGPRL